MAIKKILVSQAAPKVMTAYEEIAAKYGVSFDFIPFFKISPLTSMEMRSQRCCVTDYNAVVFSSRSTIDAFFSLCEELRVKIPETMKYFCSNEKVAMYLQKHIVYRKRKIFFGDGTPSSILGLITAKHKDDNFLVVTCDSPANSVTKVFDTSSFKHGSAVFAKSVPSDLSAVDIDSYDALVFYNKMDVASLKQNFPSFGQNGKAIVAYGSESLRKALDEAGLSISISAPAPDCPSVTAAIARLLSDEAKAAKSKK